MIGNFKLSQPSMSSQQFPVANFTDNVWVNTCYSFPKLSNRRHRSITSKSHLPNKSTKQRSGFNGQKRNVLNNSIMHSTYIEREVGRRRERVDIRIHTVNVSFRIQMSILSVMHVFISLNVELREKW